MAYASRVEIVQGLPDAVRSFGLTGVGGAGDTMVVCITEGGNMLINWIPRFVAGNIEADNMPVPEFFYQLHRLHALLIIKMSERAEDNANLDTCLADTFIYSAVYSGDDLFGSETLLKVLQRGKADLSIDHVVPFELVEHIQGDQ